MPWFRISFAENAFLRLLKERGVTLETLTRDEGIDAMLAFYAEYRPQHGAHDELELTWVGQRLAIVRHMTRTDDSTPHALVLTLRLDRPHGEAVTDRTLEFR